MPATPAGEGDTSFLNREALEHLNGGRAPYLVGGTLGCQAHTGTHRTNARTAHLELFVRDADRRRVLDLLRERSWEAIGDVSHWLTRARRGDSVIDVWGFRDARLEAGGGRSTREGSPRIAVGESEAVAGA